MTENFLLTGKDNEGAMYDSIKFIFPKDPNDIPVDKLVIRGELPVTLLKMPDDRCGKFVFIGYPVYRL